MATLSPPAFRASVEARLGAEAMAKSRPINRQRTLLVMERFLARLFAVAPETFVLKGGLAMELRMDRARTTRDIDLRAVGRASDLGALLDAATTYRPSPEDWLEFSVVPNPDHPEIEAPGHHYEGYRFVARASLAGKPFGDTFGLDIAYADPMVGVPRLIDASPFFTRYDIPSVRVPVYPLATHIAEKIHAYTMPRPRQNSRVKDLVDLAMFATLDEVDVEATRHAISATFAFRGTHPIPAELPPPPPSWPLLYERMQRDDGLPWRTIDEVLSAARALADPLLKPR
jgi:hypothetical protein